MLYSSVNWFGALEDTESLSSKKWWVRGMCKARRAFSLSELLLVLAIIGIVTAFSIPLAAPLVRAASIRGNYASISGLLEQARQIAVAENTYTWVAFRSEMQRSGTNTLSVAILVSRDGTNPVGWSPTALAVPYSRMGLIGKVETFQQILLRDAGVFTSADVKTLPEHTADPEVNGLARDVSFQIPVGGKVESFAQVIQFTPTGEARNCAGVIDFIELTLQPAFEQPSSSKPTNAAVLRVNGLTGLSRMYRN